MTNYRISEAAQLIGVSDDTLRRWISEGLMSVSKDRSGRQVVDGVDLARRAHEIAVEPPDNLSVRSSARNRFAGIVTNIVSDKVMSKVQIQCGPFTVTSLMSTEAAHDLGLEVGSRAVAVIKSTNVMVETE